MDVRFSQENPEVARIIAEMNALNTCLRAITNPKEGPDALRLVRQVLEGRSDPASFEDYVALVAMKKIVGDELPPAYTGLLAMHPWYRAVFEVTGLAWVAWASGKSDDAEKYIRQLRGAPQRSNQEEDDSRRGAIHLLALYNWAKAVEALAVGAPEEADRFFKRAYEIGSSFGTESHPLVLWTMAASFLKPPATPSKVTSAD